MDTSVAQYSPEPSPSSAPAPACLACGSADAALRFAARRGPAVELGAYCCTSFGHRTHAPIWGCRGCGVLFQWPAPEATELLASYGAVEDPLYLEEAGNRYLTFRRVLRRLGPPAGRRLLDVGAYAGFFVDVARQGGFEAEGIELSRWAVAHARARGLPVRNESIEERARAGGAYDVLTLWDVVEHLRDPRADLAACRELLRPGGRLHVSTIDAASPVARLLGARWPWLMDMHLVYFDRRTLPTLLERVGFRVVERRSYTHVVSAGYLLRKAGASFPALARALRLAGRLVPAALPVPVNLGDNMLVTAERR